jgi:ParB family chromosome partitioning protein
MKPPTLLKIDRVPVAAIAVENRLRPVTEAGVESLMASIRETGVMKDAIHVRKKKGGALVLLAGGHRLEAARRLGWELIEAKVWTDVTDDWARLIEVDDNLAGAEMNALDTSIFLAERKRVYEKLHPETVHGGDRRSPNFQVDIMSVRSFAGATAEKFGITERHVRRMVSVGGRLSADEVRWLRGAPAPVRLADLQALAKLGDEHERKQVCIALSNGAAKTAAAAVSARRRELAGAPPPKGRVETAFIALLTAWDRAPKAARRRFVEERGAELSGLITEEAGE